MIRVYSALSLIEGQLVCDLLNQSDIPAQLFHQNAQGALGELPVTHPEVWIKRQHDYDRALSLIEEFENRPQILQERVCQTCQEKNPATFDLCWQCNQPFDP